MLHRSVHDTISASRIGVFFCISSDKSTHDVVRTCGGPPLIQWWMELQVETYSKTVCRQWRYIELRLIVDVTIIPLPKTCLCIKDVYYLVHATWTHFFQSLNKTHISVASEMQVIQDDLPDTFQQIR